MAALDFPASPTLGQIYTANGKSWQWDGTSWQGILDVTSGVTGTLPVANGGTGATTLTANSVLLGNGTSAPLTVAPGTSGNLLTSNGTTWTSAAAPTPTIASTAESEAGTNNTNFITPLRMREGFNASGTAPVYACRAWVNFNGTGTVAIRGSGNVSSITDNGVGDYTVNFATAMPDANFASQGFAWASNKNAAAIFLGQPVTTTNPQTASSVRVATRDNISETILFDATVINVSVFR